MEFQPLDGRVISYWRVHSLISTAVLLFLALAGGGILAFKVPALIPVIIGVWLSFLLFRIFWLFWYPTRAYRAWGYRIDDKVLETRQGIWFRTVMLLPLSRLQHVDLHRGPMERGFGLATLLLHTAGTMNATIEIPGLEAEWAARLRDHLVAVGGDDGV